MGARCQGYAMQTRCCLKALFLLALLGAATGVKAQVDPQRAQRYFKEATKLCKRDAGRLWGVSLCGPMVIFDPASLNFTALRTRFAIACAIRS